MHKTLLLVIIIIAAVLRFIYLDKIPPSLTWDEASWGYNAYALGIDGKDEFGRFLPIDYLESFGDFKPPIYAYFSVLPVKIFGLNEFSVRFVSAFFGSLTILMSFLLAKEIFYKSVNRINYALATAALLTISPWHINLSRAAFEANLASFFIISGVYFFLLAVRKNSWYLVGSAVFFAISIHTFNTARIVTPLLVLMLSAVEYKQLIKNNKSTIAAFIVGLFIIMPAIPFLASPLAKLRYNEVNIFSDIGVIERTNEQIELDNNHWWSKIIHNRRFAYGVEFIKHYLDNFSPGFLFINGDGNPKFSTQDVGLLYLWELPFFIIGILYIINKKESKWWIVPIWILISIIPAATARETPHALRIETAVPMFQILTVYGIVVFFSDYKAAYYKTGLRKLFAVFLSFVILLNLIYYLNGYYNYYPKEFSGEWQYGYKEAIEYIQSNEDKYEYIYVTESMGRPYIYFLFYTKTDPNNFRTNSTITRESLGFVHVNHFDKFYFAKEIRLLPKKTQKTLYIDVPDKVPASALIVKKFNLLNGNSGLVAYTQ